MIELEGLGSCRWCPHDCGIDRTLIPGKCGARDYLEINLTQLHFGEEPVISGSRGSGTVFFSHCNLHCVFCQNFNISQLGWGKPASIESLCEMLLDLQAQGAHNVNLVSPTQYTAHILSALVMAKDRGLQIPVVWNSNAYEKVEVLRKLDGLVDIYLPDYKYAHGLYSGTYSAARDYPAVALAAIQEMWKQVGKLHVDPHGLASRGVIVRHLVLPNRISGTIEALNRLYDAFGPDLCLSLMAQYYPAGNASAHVELQRGISSCEYEDAVECARELGFEQVFVQELSCSDEWTPKFAR